MEPKRLYLLLATAGAVLPYSQFLPWFRKHGFNGSVLWSDLFANGISAFFGVDVIVSAVVLFAFIAIENRRRPVRLWWVPILATLGVGVSLGLPLFLYLREQGWDRRRSTA